MWFNSTQREEPYLGSKCTGIRQKRRRLAIDRYIGAAWLSSARVVRCWVKSRNERNPYLQGYTRATMAGTNRCKPARGSQSEKAGLSSDWSLQLDSMKLESLVIVDQHRSEEHTSE